MSIAADRKFDWIGVLSVVLAAAVMTPSLIVLAVTVITVAVRIL